MWTDAGPLRQMRAQARAALPPRACLRRDRGDALFVTNAPAFDPALREVPGFIAERCGGLLFLLPDASWLRRWERRFPEPPDDLCAGLARFRGEAPDRGNLLLFAQGVKLLDGGATADELAAYDRSLRQRAALALRGGCGGGLYAAAIINHELNVKEVIT